MTLSKQSSRNCFLLALYFVYLVLVPVDANPDIKDVLQKLNSFRRRVMDDVQSALANNHRNLNQHPKIAVKSINQIEQNCKNELKKVQKQGREEVNMLKDMLDEAHSELERVRLKLQNQELNAKAEIDLKVQIESDAWRAKYSRLLKEQSIKAASLEHVKKENNEIKEEVQALQEKLHQVENERAKAESKYSALKQELDNIRGMSSTVNEAKNRALENAWIGRQDAESELMALKLRQRALLEELDGLRGSVSITDAVKDKALENAWTLLQETMDELAEMHKIVEQLRQAHEQQKAELLSDLGDEVNKSRQDYSKLLQSHSAMMTEFHYVQADNHALREELENFLGQTKTIDAVKTRALENAWFGQHDAQKQLVFANQLMDVMRKQIEKLQDLVDQREKEAGQVAEAASSLAKLQRDFEAEASSKHAALTQQNKELETKVQKLQKELEGKAIEQEELVNSRLLEAKDHWWKKLSSAKNQSSKKILLMKNTEISKLNRNVDIMSSELETLRVENERLVALLNERHDEIVLLSSGTQTLARVHEEFKISIEKHIDDLNRRVVDTQALLDRKDEELGSLQGLLDDCSILAREQTAKSNKECLEMILERESQTQSQVAAASNASMAAIDAVQQDLRHAYEQLYRVTEQNRRMEVKLISQENQLNNCSTFVETIALENSILNEQHEIRQQKVVAEVDELRAILQDKNDELTLLQTTLGEKIDETELLVEKAVFETAAEWQQNLRKIQNDCQINCSKAATVDDIEDQLKETNGALEASISIARELRESLDHCRLESVQLSDTSSRLAKLHERCQVQVKESEVQFRLEIEDFKASARENLELITSELFVCQNELNEAETSCSRSLSVSEQQCEEKIQSIKKVLEEEVRDVKRTYQVDRDREVGLVSEALEKANRQASECRRDLDRLSTAAQGLSKFQIIVDERASEVQNSVSAQLEIAKAELDEKDKQVRELSLQIQKDVITYEDKLRDLEESCSQKLSWLENSNHVKIQSLEESRESVLRHLERCSEESSYDKAEAERLGSVVTELSEERKLLDLKYLEKESEFLEMKSELHRKEEILESLREAVVTQKNQMEKDCQSAMKSVEEEMQTKIQEEKTKCVTKIKQPSDLCPCNIMPNQSENRGVKTETESSMTQKLWTLFGQNSEAYDEQRLEAAIEQRTMEWKTKFQDLENKSTALLKETEEALKICYNYGEKKVKNMAVELDEICQAKLYEQEIQHNKLFGMIQSDLDKATQETLRITTQLGEITTAFAAQTEQNKKCSTSVEELEREKEEMGTIIKDLRNYRDDFVARAKELEDKLFESQRKLEQERLNSEYWHQVYEQRTYLNFSLVKEDAALAYQDAQKYYDDVLKRTEELLKPFIPVVIELAHRAQATMNPLVESTVQLYNLHARTHVNPVIDAGLATYKNTITPLYQEFELKRQEIQTRSRLLMNSIFTSFVEHISKSCPHMISHLDHLEKRTELRIFQAGKDRIELLCLNPDQTLISIFKILGVTMLFLLRRPLVSLLLGVIRLLIWTTRLIISIALAPFRFVFRCTTILIRLVYLSLRRLLGKKK